MDGLDFGAGTDLNVGDIGGGAGAIATPSFNFPNFNADLNIGNLAGQSGIGNLNAGGLNFGGTGAPTGGGVDNFTGLGWPDEKAGTTLKDVSGMAKDVAPILGIGTTLANTGLGIASLGAAGRANKAVESSIATSQRAAAPGIAASEKLLPAGTDALLTGKLPPELEAAVNDQVNTVKEQLLQHLVSQGIDPATANSMIEGQLQELRTNLTTQYAESLLGGGSSTGSQAVAAAGTAGKLAAFESSNAGGTLQTANQALGRLLGSGNVIPQNP